VEGGGLLPWEEAVVIYEEMLRDMPPDDQIDYNLAAERWQEFLEGHGIDPQMGSFKDYFMGAQTFALNVAHNSHPATVGPLYALLQRFGILVVVMDRKRREESNG
jgi:hypothetical protein